MQYILPPFFYSKAFAVPFFYFWAFPFLIWTTFWKGMALWKSARNHQNYWFITLLLINTVGILEIIYLCCFQKNEPPPRLAETRLDLAKRARRRKAGQSK